MISIEQGRLKGSTGLSFQFDWSWRAQWDSRPETRMEGYRFAQISIRGTSLLLVNGPD